jgi:phage minor structural protein
VVCVYAQDCTDFSTNGYGSICPSSCLVTETLNGEWELTLTHPLDEAGKWQRLVEGCILRAPVPAAMTPRVKLVDQNTGRDIYQVVGGRLRLRTGPGTEHRILTLYPTGTEVIILNQTNPSWYEVTAPDGKHGYMSTEFLSYVRTEGNIVTSTGQVVESRQLREQPFRIYRVVPELNKVTVYARHVFYDLMDNMIQSYKPSPSTIGATVAQNISSQCRTNHGFTLFSDLTSTANDVLLANINPVEAVLGEGGMTEKYSAELARDWFDVFLVQRVGSDTDVQIRQGKNLLGISYDVDLTNVVTRIMPTGETEDGEILYLDELYHDSPHISSYPHPKWIHLPVSEAKVSDDLTIEQAKTKMREAAQAEFDAGCDLPTVTLDVDFINCTDTVEYKPYGFLQNIFLGDSVRVIARRIGVEVSMRMTQYTYDCLTRKYTGMTLGTVADTVESNMISARQLGSGIITGAKLAINSVGTGQLQSGSVGNLQIKMAAIGTAHIADAAITRAKIAEATVGSLNVEALNAVTAKIEELSVGNLNTDTLYAALATIAIAQITQANLENANICWADIGTLAAQIADIAVAQITAANIEQANIDWANIASLYVKIAEIASAQITTANIQNAGIDWASITELNAVVANIAVAQITTAHLQAASIDWATITELNTAIANLVRANIQTADIDWAQIKDLTAGTAIIQKGVNGKLYVADLAVTEANMATLTVGELIVKGADGGFYAVSVDETGTVTTQKKEITGTDVADGSLSGGKLIENTVTARELNVSSIFADQALIGAIKAVNLDVDDLFANAAFITNLQTVDISGNTALRLYVEGEVATAKDEALDAVGDAVSMISITADAIRNEVRQQYAPQEDVSQLGVSVASLSEQTESNFTWAVSQINELNEVTQNNQALTEEQLNLIRTYMQFGEDGLTIGKTGNPVTFRVVNDRVAFYMNNTEVAYLSDNKLYVTQAEILTKLVIGKFAFVPQTNGNLSVLYTD